MVTYDRVSQVSAIEMRIYFRRGDGFVPQHLLHRAQVGASFHQVRGKRMAQGMWADRLADPAFDRQFFDDLEDHDPGKFYPPLVQEQNVLRLS